MIKLSTAKKSNIFNVIKITVIVFVLSLPALAVNAVPINVTNSKGDATLVDKSIPNDLMKFIQENESFAKIVISFLGGLLAVGGAVYVGIRAHESPKKLVKLEQLKLIDLLTLEGALSKPERYFVVEEAFRLYFNKHIPISIIKILCDLEVRFYAFTAYEKISHLVSFNKDNNKIKFLSREGKKWHFRLLISTWVLILHITSISGIFSYALLITSIPKGNVLFFLFGCFFVIFTCAMLYVFFKMIDPITDFYFDARDFEKKLKGYIESTEVRRKDVITTLVIVIPLVVFWGAKVFFL